MIDTSQSTSTRPYLLRALYEWCADNGLTPYVAAYVDETVRVPREHVKNNEIVLNISMDATSNLHIGNDFLKFKARFGGQAREIEVPIDHVIAIYARENGQGMAFPVPQALQPRGEVKESSAAERKSPGLRPVSSVKPSTPSETASKDANPAQEASASNPLLESFVAQEPAKIVRLKSAPEPVKKSAATEDAAQPHATPASPTPAATPASNSKATPRPSLTRIK